MATTKKHAAPTARPHHASPTEFWLIGLNRFGRGDSKRFVFIQKPTFVPATNRRAYSAGRQLLNNRVAPVVNGAGCPGQSSNRPDIADRIHAFAAATIIQLLERLPMRAPVDRPAVRWKWSLVRSVASGGNGEDSRQFHGLIPRNHRRRVLST